MIKYIRSKKGKLIAIILSRKTRTKGIKFFSQPDFPQQIGLLQHKKGAIIRPHTHRPIKRVIFLTQEVLYIKRGRIAISLYDEEGRYLCRRILKGQDAIFLSGGGHGIKVLEDSVIMEVKQGPYLGREDKEYLKVSF